MSRFLLAIPRILWYAVLGAVSSTPVGGSPRSFGGEITSLTPNQKKGGGASRSESNKRLPVAITPLFIAYMVSWPELIQFCSFLVALIALIAGLFDHK